MTGGAIDDMKRIFAEVEELLTSLNAESKSSSEAEDDGEDDGDDGGDWDYSANLQWPPSNDTVVADVATLFPSTESTHISGHGEAGATEFVASAVALTAGGRGAAATAAGCRLWLHTNSRKSQSDK